MLTGVFKTLVWSYPDYGIIYTVINHVVYICAYHFAVPAVGSQVYTGVGEGCLKEIVPDEVDVFGIGSSSGWISGAITIHSVNTNPHCTGTRKFIIQNPGIDIVKALYGHSSILGIEIIPHHIEQLGKALIREKGPEGIIHI